MEHERWFSLHFLLLVFIPASSLPFTVLLNSIVGNFSEGLDQGRSETFVSTPWLRMKRRKEKKYNVEDTTGDCELFVNSTSMMRLEISSLRSSPSSLFFEYVRAGKTLCTTYSQFQFTPREPQEKKMTMKKRRRKRNAKSDSSRVRCLFSGFFHIANGECED